MDPEAPGGTEAEPDAEAAGSWPAGEAAEGDAGGAVGAGAAGIESIWSRSFSNRLRHLSALAFASRRFDSARLVFFSAEARACFVFASSLSTWDRVSGSIRSDSSAAIRDISSLSFAPILHQARN